MIKLKDILTEKKNTQPPKKDNNPVFTLLKKISGLKYPKGTRFGYTGTRYSPEFEDYNNKYSFEFFASKWPESVSYDNYTWDFGDKKPKK